MSQIGILVQTGLAEGHEITEKSSAEERLTQVSWLLGILIFMNPLASAELRLADVIYQLKTENPCWSLDPKEFQQIEKTYVCRGLSKNGLFDLKYDNKIVLQKMVFSLAAQSQVEWLGCYKDNLKEFGSSPARKKWLESSKFLLQLYFKDRVRAAKLRAYERLKSRKIESEIMVNTGTASEREQRIEKIKSGLLDGKHDYAAEARVSDERAESYLELIGFSDVPSIKKRLVDLIDQVVGPRIESISDPVAAAEKVAALIEKNFDSIMDEAAKDVEMKRESLLSVRVMTKDGSYFNLPEDWKQRFYSQGQVAEIIQRNYPSSPEAPSAQQEKLLNCFAGDYGPTAAMVETSTMLVESLLMGASGVVRGTGRAMMGALVNGTLTAASVNMILPEIVKSCMQTRLELIAASEKICTADKGSGNLFLSKWLEYNSCLGEVLMSLSPI